jgi:hypothetical protein
MDLESNKKRPAREDDDTWVRPTRGMLRVEMIRRDMKYADLVKALAAIEIEIDERVLRNKIARGTFSAVFFIQCLVAMKVSNLEINSTHFPIPGQPMIWPRGAWTE